MRSDWRISISQCYGRKNLINVKHGNITALVNAMQPCPIPASRCIDNLNVHGFSHDMGCG
jgi:hypothetical protein